MKLIYKIYLIRWPSCYLKSRIIINILSGYNILKLIFFYTFWHVFNTLVDFIIYIYIILD